MREIIGVATAVIYHYFRLHSMTQFVLLGLRRDSEVSGTLSIAAECSNDWQYLSVVETFSGDTCRGYSYTKPYWYNHPFL